jgi:hypothetical protein
MASHYLPLEQAPQGYAKFQKKADGCTKVVPQPGRTEPEVHPGGVLAARKPGPARPGPRSCGRARADPIPSSSGGPAWRAPS